MFASDIDSSSSSNGSIINSFESTSSTTRILFSRKNSCISALVFDVAD